MAAPTDKQPRGRALPGVETREPEFRELTRLRDFDRQQHIQKSIEMGMTREEAERHAEKDLQDRDDSQP